MIFTVGAEHALDMPVERPQHTDARMHPADDDPMPDDETIALRVIVIGGQKYADFIVIWRDLQRRQLRCQPP